MTAFIYSSPGQRGVETRVDRAVRGLCRLHKSAKGANGQAIPLNGAIVDELVQKMIYAVSHAAGGAIPNRVRGRGAPPDNARIILADDVLRPYSELGIHQGLRYAPPQSFAVELFNAVAPIIFATGGHNPRKTFDRLRRHPITRN